MKVENYKPTKSSFLSIEKDIKILRPLLLGGESAENAADRWRMSRKCCIFASLFEIS